MDPNANGLTYLSQRDLLCGHGGSVFLSGGDLGRNQKKNQEGKQMIKMDKELLHIKGMPRLIWAELGNICEAVYNQTKEDIGEGDAKKY